jgi:hypothetical protein
MSWSFLCSGSSVKMIDDCLFKRTIIYHLNSLNTRNTTTSTKQTIIYHLNRTPWTQERPRHLQNEQSSIILTWSFLCSGISVKMIDDCSFCRCRGLSCVQGVLLRNTATSTKQTIIHHLNRTPWTQETPRHLQNKQSSIILTELPEHKKDHDIYKTNNHLSS